MAEEQQEAAPKAEKKQKEQKVKRPSALKRDMQSEKQRLRNRSFRSSVMTAVRALDSSISKKEGVKDKLQEIYSIVDKGVKHGVFKTNKAARMKSRLSARVAKA